MELITSITLLIPDFPGPTLQRQSFKKPPKKNPAKLHPWAVYHMYRPLHWIDWSVYSDLPGTPKDMGPPYGKLPILFPYHSHIWHGNSMGYNGVPCPWGSLQIPLMKGSHPTKCEKGSGCLFGSKLQVVFLKHILHPRSFTACPWKMVVSFWNFGNFSGAMLNFGRVIYVLLNFVYMRWYGLCNYPSKLSFL